MMKKLGLDWRVSLLQECLFYFVECKNWGQVIQARLYDNPLDRFETRGGTLIEFPHPPPWQVFQEIWRSQIYTRWLPYRSWNPRTVVDVGANIGIFALYAAQHWRQAHILAFEPAPENVKWLAENIRRNAAARIDLYPMAVAGNNGSMPFYLKAESGWHSLEPTGGQTTIRVNATTLDGIVESIGSGCIDLLKVDCEGGEYDFFANHQDLLRKKVCAIALEYHIVDGHSARELIDIFSSAGFSTKSYPDRHWATGMLYASNPAL